MIILEIQYIVQRNKLEFDTLRHATEGWQHFITNNDDEDEDDHEYANTSTIHSF